MMMMSHFRFLYLKRLKNLWGGNNNATFCLSISVEAERVRIGKEMEQEKAKFVMMHAPPKKGHHLYSFRGKRKSFLMCEDDTDVSV